MKYQSLFFALLFMINILVCFVHNIYDAKNEIKRCKFLHHPVF